MSIVIFSDGGSRGNPGHAAAAFAVYDENNKLIHSDSKYLGINTNNFAEYNGVILALTWVSKTTTEKDIKFCMDSELVMKQLSGIYKIKNEVLVKLSETIKNMQRIHNLNIKWVHVPREQNSFADSLVNENLDNSSRR